MTRLLLAIPLALAVVATPAVSAAAHDETDVSDDPIVNVWSDSTVDPTALPIGDDFVSTTGAERGWVYTCLLTSGGGAFADGPWIDADAGTWDSTAKIAVDGAVLWPEADYEEAIVDDRRIITSAGLPVDDPTGEFPIAPNDEAAQYDRNPNSIAEQTLTISLPANPTVSQTPGCLSPSAVGILGNGVVVFAPLDAENRDAAAHEVQDTCDGHPEATSQYHYHDVSSCILDAATGSSTVVGWAFDGFPIVVERDADGRLPTNADLDECHGRISEIDVDGERVSMYHYSATLEFPYLIGCYRGAQAAGLDIGSLLVWAWWVAAAGALLLVTGVFFIARRVRRTRRSRAA